MVSLGVVLATLSRTTGDSPASQSSSKTAEEMRRYALGVGMLVLSLLLTGILGVLQEQTYQVCGPCWQEGVFYTVCRYPSSKSITTDFNFLALSFSSRLCVPDTGCQAGIPKPHDTSFIVTIWLAMAFAFDFPRGQSTVAASLCIRGQPPNVGMSPLAISCFSCLS